MRRSRPFPGVCALVLVTHAITASAQSPAPPETREAENATAASVPSPAAAKPVEPITPAASPGAVRISLITDDSRVGLYAKETRKITLHDEVADSWEFVCKAPCDQRVEPNRIYRVMGDGIIPSKDFNLAPGSGRVTLQVSPASHGARVAGGIIGGVGTAFVASSVLLLLFEVAARSAANAFVASSYGAMYGGAAQTQLESTADIFEILGITFAAVGVASWITALAISLSSNTGLDPVGSTHHASTSPPSGLRLIPGGFAF